MPATDNRWAAQPEQLSKVKAALVERHADTEIFYTNCSHNGCFDNCVIRSHVKDGKCIAIETDDTIHQGFGREDAYVDESDLRKGLYQKRACPRGRAIRQDYDSENRILYPMRRVGPKGTLDFERISWDEALDTIAKKWLETREEFGPFSVYGDGMLDSSFDCLSCYLPGGGIAAWGEDSYEPSNFADTMVYGRGNDLAAFYSGQADGNTELQTFMDTDLIILFGYDPAINYPYDVWWILMAKERGVPVIVIDPRYTWTAQACATQYIPIRPDTDTAMLLAMAQVMFEEDLVDHEFIEKWVEPIGLEKWRKYVMGEEYNEVPKTPEWAAEICGVPAETIRELARLYAAADACYFRQVWAVGRKIYGKDAPRAHNYVQALGGNVGKKGNAGMACGHGSGGAHPRPFPFLYLGSDMTNGNGNTICLEAEKISTAILDREKVDRGEMTIEEYKARIGCPPENEAPNIKMVHLLNMIRTLPTGWYDSNERIESLKKVFFVQGAWNWKNPSILYADIVLPYGQFMLEKGPKWTTSQGAEASGFLGGMPTANMFSFVSGGADNLGETRHPIWVLKQLADRMGIGDKFAPYLTDVPYEQFAAVVDQCAKGAYDHWKKEQAPSAGFGEMPEWEEFKKEPVVRWEMDDYHVFFRNERENDVPLTTPSGKIEFYSEFLATADLKTAVHPLGNKCFGGSGNIPPMAKFRKSPVSMFSPKVNDYPLFLLTPHSFYRNHTAYDALPWVRDEYRNSVWMNPADAKRRGIADNDLVRVFSDAGELQCHAYVTSRMTPGVICIPFGRYQENSGVKTELSPEGIDTRGNCNILIKDEFYDDILGALLCSALCQIEKADSPRYVRPENL